MPTPGPAPSKHCSASLACLRPGLAGSAAACARCFPPRRRRARRSSYWRCRIFLPAASHWASRRWPSRTGWGGGGGGVWALFSTGAAARQAQQLLEVQDFFAGCQPLGITPVAEQDWVWLTQAQFAPVEITAQFWIVPSWHALPAQAVHSLRLDPGLAFGTGTHPSTRMCLRWIAGQGAPEGQPLGRVLDYGCGSGILALAAAKFGARDVDAVDIDPAAVQATARNAQANAVQLHAGLPEQARGEYQTVLANILATPLRVLAPLLCGHLTPGGRLVLAGILERQAQVLKQAYAPWLALTVTDAEDGWILMTACRH